MLRTPEALGRFQTAVPRGPRSEYTPSAGIRSLVSDGGHEAFLAGFCTMELIIYLQHLENPPFRWGTCLKGSQVDRADEGVQGKEFNLCFSRTAIPQGGGI